MRIIKATSPITPEIALTMGGKGSNLYKLTQSGAAVPPFFVLGSPCFTEFLTGFQAEFERIVDALDCSTPARVAETSRQVREFLCQQRMPAAIAQEAMLALKEIAGEGDFLAVRSSALGEDSKEFSYAGMLDSYLFRKTPEEVQQAVLECWASLYSDRAVAYRHMRGVSQKGLAMAVVVQKMIDGSASGVTFTVNPNTKYADEILISAVPGLGEGLVSGGLDADQFVVLKGDTYAIDTRTVADKVGRVVFDRDKGFGTIEKELPPETRNKA
ncbi:MAG TPA: PEP/pyruvate-binding domain-containing protein, partial [Candidatus Ozemobacteraceae bacterium]|nr:PEP/pyruvate-binding domain-containing protein [Candidatus Ozemobacteraceae bacterium]